MIDRTHDLSVARQAQLVGISRGTVYYRPAPVGDADLRLMRRVDELHLELPFAGSRMLRDLLKGEGFEVGRRHVATLMRRMGIEALYKKPNTSKKHPGHLVFPYLLRGLAIEHANQVWAMDITYIPMARGFMFLTAVLDWHSRRVLAHRGLEPLIAHVCHAAGTYCRVPRAVVSIFEPAALPYSTVTDFAKFLGLSTSVPLATAV